MSVDVEAMRKRASEVLGVVGNDCSDPRLTVTIHISACDVIAMLDEIVTLRERVAEQAAIIEGLGDVIAGRVKPISQLWDEIDADEQSEG